MFALITSALVLVLAVAIVRWMVSVPLLRTLSASIDCWADSVQGGVQGGGAEQHP